MSNIVNNCMRIIHRFAVLFKPVSQQHGMSKQCPITLRSKSRSI
jgi:hypothetical protein